MFYTKLLRSTAVGATCVALAACGSSTATPPAGGAAGGGGGAGGGGATPFASFTTAYDTALGAVPTQTPLTGTAGYTGKVRLNTGTATLVDEDNAIIGDLDLDVSFDGGTNPISGTATNFAGKINGADATIGGTLTANTQPGGLNAITTSQVNIPGQGTATFTSMAVRLSGDLTDATNTINGTANLNLQGNFTGAGGANNWGPATLDTQNSSGAAGNGLTGGQYYITKD